MRGSVSAGLLMCLLAGYGLGCASRGVDVARQTLNESQNTAWALRAASEELIVAVSPAQKTLRLAGSSGLVIGTGISAVADDKYRRQMLDALGEYDPALAFEERLAGRLTDLIGPGRVAPPGTTAGHENRRAAHEDRCQRLAEAGYSALLDLKMTFGLYGPAGTLVAQLDAALYALPGGQLRWSDTVTVNPGPLLADTRLGHPAGGMMPDFGGKLMSKEEDAISQWTDDGGARFRIEYEACVDDAISSVLCALGLVQEAKGEYRLGCQELNDKNYAEAEVHFRTAVGLDPDFVDARDALSVNHAHAGRIDEAIALAAAILQDAPDYGPAHYNLAWWYAIESGDTATARPHYERALALGMPISRKLEKAFEEPAE